MEAIRECVKHGLEELGNFSSIPSSINEKCTRLQEELKAGNENTIKTAMNYLSEKLRDPNLTKVIGKCFPSILISLLSEAVPVDNSCYTYGNGNTAKSECEHRINCMILGKLVDKDPNILKYSLKYFYVNPAPFANLTDETAAKIRKVSRKFTITDREIVECCLSLLRCSPDAYSKHKDWDWSIFLDKFFRTSDEKQKWMVCQCIAIVTGMSEGKANKFYNGVFGDASVVNLFKIRDGDDSYVAIKGNSNPTPNIQCVLRMLPVFNSDNIVKGNLVPVQSTLDNLRSITLAIASGKAICLTGPVGSGKTSLVEYLAAVTGRQNVAIKKVQLGDQTDSRTLLGTYKCTDIPGEFVWQSGILTECVLKGYWLLLEDIDCAALDVASVLSSLLEQNVLSVPGYRDSITVDPGFQLFVTQRSSTVNSHNKQASTASILLQRHLTQITIEPLSRQELIEVIQTLFGNLKTIATKMVDVFMLFSFGNHNSSLHSTSDISNNQVNESHNPDYFVMGSGRQTSTRDLLKWCLRASAVVPSESSQVSEKDRLKVLQDAIDIFTCCAHQPEDRLKLAKSVAACLGITENNAEYYCCLHKPNISITPKELHVGRGIVKRQERNDSLQLNGKQTTFSFTRPTLCLIERISCCLNLSEPVLLVGETGTGKTTSVQYLAEQTGHKLTVINMNQQSESADLLGGYKPVDSKYIVAPVKKEFDLLFSEYYNHAKNRMFIMYMNDSFEVSDWKSLLKLMKHVLEKSIAKLSPQNSAEQLSERDKQFLERWRNVGKKIAKLKVQLKEQNSLAFAFIEGSLIRAMEDGDWVLLDEINLASAETLECLAGMLEGPDSSVSLLEKGNDANVKRHTDFRLFACMNPATDVGKKDLPVGLRNRLTEFYVDELTCKNDLIQLIGDYLRDLNLPKSILENIYIFYSSIKKESKLNLTDGTGHTPHFSLRTLCRALTTAQKSDCGTISRSLFEAFCLSFLTQLDRSSHPKVQAMIAKAVLGGKQSIKSVINQPIPRPVNGCSENYLKFEGYWIPQGSMTPETSEDYILTSSVRKNLHDLARIVSLGKLPILLQGDTSVGKTSLITFMAKASGNYCVRINNHEHTDLQEYIGCYSSSPEGKLVFKEGVLVDAMRKGYWIILDELNLAPSDVLEALNRVLDDNRELFIPETQQVVRANPNFMLFATQNPPGLYGGRKVLSRAFRNRFVELHFDEIPRTELEIILHHRCSVPLSYCKRMIAVMAELQTRRRRTAAIQGKHGFITLRDIFRWGQRYKLATQEEAGSYYDWEQHLADEGFLVLGAKIRNEDENSVIQEVLGKHFKKTVKMDQLFTLSDETSPVTKPILQSIMTFSNNTFKHVVWTFNMRKLAVLIAKAFRFKEPVLLVGDTGYGKTTICQVIAAMHRCKLLTVNCHMYSESADFLGSLRPVRQYRNDGKLFEWVDGPLINAMLSGDIFLADEISLADDSVLERLNSLLEPERQLFLAEKSTGYQDDRANNITATDNFNFIGTMNPGGDYGKKELSPALRNRFTEIWCNSVMSRDDTIMILERSVTTGVVLNTEDIKSSGIGKSIVDFVQWFKKSQIGARFPCNIRDMLCWVHFINEATKCNLNVSEAFVHGACLTFLDSFGTGITGNENEKSLKVFTQQCIEFLVNQMRSSDIDAVELVTVLSGKSNNLHLVNSEDKFGIAPFFISCGPKSKHSEVICVDEHFDEHASIAKDKGEFFFDSPTTKLNTLRLLRGLQLRKAILLEGSPGVGKTSLVLALAKITSHKVFRFNLSEQTDISDLFGTDLPTEDGSFAFKEGAFLTALKNGDWILLDELNLAPQSVLEGLNACLDHRGEVYIPELGKTFTVKKNTRIFACQNPLAQGGSRKGLPMSFLNRFTQVFVEALSSVDLLIIAKGLFPTIPDDILLRMISFNSRLTKEMTELHLWGHRGSPWELNLRDIQRWGEAALATSQNNLIKPGQVAQLLYVNRMRTKEDKQCVVDIYKEYFYPEYPLSSDKPLLFLTDDRLYIGDVVIQRNVDGVKAIPPRTESSRLVLRHQLPVLKSLIQCVNMNWLSILVGPTASGKSSVVHTLSKLVGKKIKVLPVTPTMDTTDILGGFEQTDFQRHLEAIVDNVEDLMKTTVQCLMMDKNIDDATKLLSLWEKYNRSQNEKNCIAHLRTMENETKLFAEQISHLDSLIDYLQMSKSTQTIIDPFKARELSEDLKVLAYKVNRAGSLNVGGKFDWVDSLLVKCLMDGTWLLVDNVNLCSSAVLDSLNGLLEKGGMLNVPERGENNTHLRPHPDFRMFFTMDPKNGEISRAMRNRGVEIYLLGQDHNVEVSLTNSIPSLDLSAMFSSFGLPSTYHHVCCILHEELCTFINCFDRPSLNHLLQVVFLACQQYRRGFDLPTSLVYSFSDVYIKPRSKSDFLNTLPAAENKQLMLSAVKKHLAEDIQNQSDGIVPFQSGHSISLHDLQSISSLEHIKQNSFLPQYYFGLFVAHNKTEYAVKCASLLVNSYRITSSSNIEIQFQYLRKILSYGDGIVNQWIRMMNETLYINSKMLLNTNSKTLPWDLRFYPEVSREFDEASLNLASLVLNISMWNGSTELTVDLKRSTESTDDISAMEYSKAVLQKELSDIFPEYPIIKYCTLIVNNFDSCLSSILRQGNISIKNENYCDVIQLLRWRNRFYRVCSLPLRETSKRRKPTAQESMVTLPLINIHYRWLRKCFMSEILHPDTNVNDNSNILKEVDSSLDTVILPLQKVGSRIRKLGSKLLSYKNRDDYESHLLFSRLSKDLSVVSIESSRLTGQKIKMLLSDSYSNRALAMKYNLIDTPFTVEDVHNLGDVSPTLGDPDIESDNDSAVIESFRTFQFEINLWPMQEYMVLRMLNLCMSQYFDIEEGLTESNVSRRNEAFMKSLLEMVENVKSFPIEIISLLRRITEGNTSNISDCKSTLLKTLLEKLYAHINCSPSTAADNYWLHWRIETLNSSADEHRKNKERLSLYLPMLLNYVFKLVLFNEQPGTPVSNSIVNTSTLGDQPFRSEQLHKVQRLVYQNIASFNLVTNEYISSEAISCINSFKKFSYFLHKALYRSDDDTNVNLNEIIEYCISKFEELFIQNRIKLNELERNRKNKIVFSLRKAVELSGRLQMRLSQGNLDENAFEVKLMTGQIHMLQGLLESVFTANAELIDPVEKKKLKRMYLQEDVDQYDDLLHTNLLQGIVLGSVCDQTRFGDGFPFKSDCSFSIQLDLPTLENEELARQINLTHPHCELFAKKRAEIKDKLKSNSGFYAYRPFTSHYQTFAKEVNHTSNSLLSIDDLLTIYQDLVGANEKLNSFIEDDQRALGMNALLKSSKKIVLEASTRQYSLINFYIKMSKDYSDLFPEMVRPILSGVMQLNHGINNLKLLLSEQIARIQCGDDKHRIVSDYMENLIRFPVISEKCPDTLKFVDKLLSNDCKNFLNRNLRPSEDDLHPDKTECYRLLKVSLQEMKNYCAWTRMLDENLVRTFLDVLNVCVATWQQQEEETEKKRQEDDSLYVTKSKCDDKTDDEEFLEEVSEVFPSYLEEDFEDFRPPSLEQRNTLKRKLPDEHPQSGANFELISPTDLDDITRLHWDVMTGCTYVEWLKTPTNSTFNCDHLSPLLQRYTTFGKLLPSVQSTLDYKLEGNLSPSLILFLNCAQETVDGSNRSGYLSAKIDFYRSPNVAESRCGLAVISQVITATKLLLQQWPDFPTLKDIMVIATRILEFPVTSPVVRFLTGVELLREKVEEWNKNAHKGNNMANEALCLAQQIVKWRKMEVSSWKDCLNNALARKISAASKWWFHIYKVVESYLRQKPLSKETRGSVTEVEKANETSPRELGLALKEFIESSNLAEFNKRLDIIYAFHCHVANLKSSPQRDDLLSVLWNVYRYYEQFSSNVISQILNKRMPIEKKLKDFVKICTWDRDLSYWGVKDTVDRAHRALHKHVKEFEAVLSLNVQDCLVVDSNTDRVKEIVAKSDRLRRVAHNDTVDAQDYLAQSRSVKNGLRKVGIKSITRSRVILPIPAYKTWSIHTSCRDWRFFQKFLDQKSDDTLEGHLARIPNLFHKARELCKRTLLHSSYPELISNLNEFCTQLISTSTELQNLEVSPDLPKDKKKSLAKTFLQKKRLALSDLFKYLGRMGLSYRAGVIAMSNNDDDFMDLVLPPVNLEAAFSFLKKRRSDTALMSVWSCCEDYYQRSLARQSVLTTALRKPAQDLGLQNAERCKGYAANLMHAAQKQKRLIAKYSRQLCYLRSLLVQATSLIDAEASPSKNSQIRSQLKHLIEFYLNIGITLEQFSILLESVPEINSQNIGVVSFDSSVSNSPMINAHRNSAQWSKIHDKVKQLVGLTNKQITSLNKVKINMPQAYNPESLNMEPIFYTKQQKDIVDNAERTLTDIKNHIRELVEQYNVTLKETGGMCGMENPMANSLNYLQKYLSDSQNFSLQISCTIELDMTQFDHKLENLITSILLVVQKKYTSYCSDPNSTDVLIDDEMIREGHLKKKLQESLTEDIDSLKIKNISEDLRFLLQQVMVADENDDENYPKYRQKILRVVPLLEQLVLFTQYFFTQLVSTHRATCKMLCVLLKIFVELATKGFCTPGDTATDEGDGDGGPGKLNGGTGLGDGEGQKDVSDRIETQDQLDEARKPGEDDKQDKRDCKEEEKGVNMTDDFDSHLQDVEKDKDGDEQSESEDDSENADKQMGETDANADRLDQQLWGSDQESEDDSDGKTNDKDERGTGESLGDEQMVGKENSHKDQDDSKNDQDRQKEKEKNKKDINEMQEPEVDDNHIDPYHGSNQQIPEPEDFDMPDLQLDDQQNDDDNDGEMDNENPFEVDTMKEQNGLEESKDESDEQNEGKKSDTNGKLDDMDDGDSTEDENDETGEKNEKDADKNSENDDGQMDDGEINEKIDEDEENEKNNEIVDKPPMENQLQNDPEVNNEDADIEKDKEQPGNDVNQAENTSTSEQEPESATNEDGGSDNVQTNPDVEKSKKAAPFDQSQEHEGEEKEAVGQSEMSESQKGHRGRKKEVPQTMTRENAKQQQEDKRTKRNKPGHTDQERLLGEHNEPVKKKSKSIQQQGNEEGDDDSGAEEGDDDKNDADIYQHIKKAKKSDVQTVDAATKDQAESQPVPNEENEDAEEVAADDVIDVDMNDVQVNEELAEKVEPEKSSGEKKSKDRRGDNTEVGEEQPTGETAMETEGEKVLTLGVLRGNENTFHTNYEAASTQFEDHSLSVNEMNSLRLLVNESSTPHFNANNSAAADTWRHLWDRTTNQARQLSEKLRLVLEPSGRSRLAGDFRTGRRINMRRVIPYIASQFRKDRIWLRRTKPSKREYKIAVAIDDSSSMSDNQSKELAFESLALVSQALNLLEAGELSVLSFGEETNILHKFGEHFSESSGTRLLQSLLFAQTKTRIAQLVDFSSVMFEEHCSASSAINANLLVILSDGRGIFSEGEEKVRQTVKRARQNNIFIVYLIVDNPKNKDSIMDIRTPFTNATGALELRSYLDIFPFPHYIILRDISTLPIVLSDALRQWFEMAANI